MSKPVEPSQVPRRKSIQGRLWRTLLVVLTGGIAVWAGWSVAPVVMKWQVRQALAARDLERSETLLKRIGAWFGIDAESAFLWARLNRKLGRWPEVRDYLLRARDLKYPVQLLEREQWLTQAQSGQLRQAEPHLPRLLTDPRDDGAEICEAFVNGYFLNHRMSEVNKLLDAWIADFPKDAEPLLIRGKIRTEQQYLKDAESDLQAARLLAPSSTAISLELADVLVLERQVEAALDIFHKTAVAHPAEVRALLGEAKCLRLLNRLTEAKEAVHSILELDPSNRDAIAELGLVELESNEYQQAIATLERAVSLNPRSLIVRQGLARAYRTTGNAPRAREHAEYVAKSQAALASANQLASRSAENPDDADLRCQIGQIYLRYAVPELGVQWLRSALDRDPNHQGATKALADYFAGSSPKDPKSDVTDRPPDLESIPEK